MVKEFSLAQGCQVNPDPVFAYRALPWAGRLDLVGGVERTRRIIGKPLESGNA